MELISVNLKDFRRFEGSETLKTEGKLVAIIGANETGKSSILEALASLNHNDPLSRRATTWGKKPEDTTIEVAFRLTAEESASMSGASRLIVRKKAGGQRTFEFVPKVRRDWSLRDKASARLRALERRSGFLSLSEQFETEEFNLLEETKKVASSLEADLEDLPEDTVNLLPHYVSRVRKSLREACPRYLGVLLDQLERIHSLEKNENPGRIAERKAGSLLPTFAFFNEDMRLLDDSYSIADVAGSLPPSLGNLLALAGLDVGELHQAVQAGVLAEIRTLEDRANRTLAERVSSSWSQSDLLVRLTCDAGNLRVLVQDTSQRYSDLSERSDGLRQFVALRAFMAQAHLREPILLIDELEQRLHYDAQADLVQVLQSQSLVPKIIYTTHSAGSLPEDLGRGVHVAAKRTDAPHYSKLINRFWEKEEPGFSPLLVGLGASTLAFFPTRRAVVAEGPSEMLLVPFLLREALGVDHLDFQVVPGLSSVSRTKLPALNANGAHVSYLVDADSGGAQIIELLKGAGVPDKFIFRLMVSGRMGHSIEDFVNVNVLLAAANRLGATYTDNWRPITRREIPSMARAQALKASFDNRNQPRFSKIDLAYAILDIIEDTRMPVCDKRRRATLVELAGSIVAVFQETESQK